MAWLQNTNTQWLTKQALGSQPGELGCIAGSAMQQGANPAIPGFPSVEWQKRTFTSFVKVLELYTWKEFCKNKALEQEPWYQDHNEMTQ